jgi:protein gp37
MSTSTIEWTEHTWNPVTGCDKVSPGCAHCYAEVVALRFWPMQYPPIEVEVPIGDCSGDANITYRDRSFTDVQCHEDRLDQPLKRRKPTTYFVNSMSDLFHEDVPDTFIDRVFAVMALAPQHTFQILTKRAERMRACLSTADRAEAVLDEATDIAHDNIANTAYLQDAAEKSIARWPLPNVWLGVSVENQHFADERIPLLLQTPAAVRFISAEPLLEEVSFRWAKWQPLSKRPGESTNHLDGLRRLDWVIVGGESGAGARLFRVEWARSIIEQCRAANVPVFMKQIGANPISALGLGGMISNSKGGDPAEWPEDLRVREFPEARA